MPKFISLYDDVPFVGVDLSNELEDTFIELPPYAKNELGEFLNESSLPKLVSSGKINIQEKIQSFERECDIYEILRRYNLGDLNALNQRDGVYCDVSNIPNNINDLNANFTHAMNDMSNLPKELQEMIINENASNDDIMNSINSYVENLKKSLVAQAKTNDDSEVVNNE